MIRCVVADDQQMVREGFGALLDAQDDMTVTGHAANGAEAVEVARATDADVVLMDIRMPGTDGIEATRRLMAASDPVETHVRVLILTTFDLDEYVFDALRAGASGFLLKDAPASELLHAVRVVAAGEALLAPSVTRRLIADFTARRAAPDPPAPEHTTAIGRLTPRELEVLGLIARGMSNSEIAAHLVVAEQTVKTHVSRVLTKLGLRDRAQAVVLAYESGVVNPGEA